MPDGDVQRPVLNDGADQEAAVTIVINGAAYSVTEQQMSGHELRRLPFPPIGDDQDLWLEKAGEPDRYLRSDELMELTDGMRLFAVPRSIMAGADRAARH